MPRSAKGNVSSYIVKETLSTTDIIIGTSSVLDVSATLSGHSIIVHKIKSGMYNPIKADIRAVASDWAVVGEDIYSAMIEFSEEIDD